MPEAGPGRPILSVIIPALNEAENLRSLLPALQETLAGLGVRSEVIEHVPPDPGLFREMVRVLAPGGVLILGTPDYSRWIWRVIERVYGWVLPGAYAKEHITRYHAAGLRQLLQAMGCQLLEARYVGFSEWIAKSRKVGPCAPGLAIPTWG